MSKKDQFFFYSFALILMLFSVAAAMQPVRDDIMSGPTAQIEYNGESPGPDDFVEVDKMPVMIYQSTPEYPRLARQAGMEGTVWIKSYVNEQGLVENAVVSKPSGSKAGFDQSALKSAYECKYKPAMKDGEPVAVWITYKVNFVLDGTEAGLIGADDNNERYPEPDQFVPVDQMPAMLYEETPVYPPKARKSGIEATVYVKSLVDKKGEVVKAMIAKASNDAYGFDQAALDAAYKCKFKPAMQNGQPVATWVIYSVKFILSGDNEDKETIE
jgi:TonB family protein